MQMESNEINLIDNAKKKALFRGYIYRKYRINKDLTENWKCATSSCKSSITTFVDNAKLYTIKVNAKKINKHMTKEHIAQSHSHPIHSIELKEKYHNDKNATIYVGFFFKDTFNLKEFNDFLFILKEENDATKSNSNKENEVLESNDSNELEILNQSSNSIKFIEPSQFYQIMNCQVRGLSILSEIVNENNEVRSSLAQEPSKEVKKRSVLTETNQYINTGLQKSSTQTEPNQIESNDLSKTSTPIKVYQMKKISTSIDLNNNSTVSTEINQESNETETHPVQEVNITENYVTSAIRTLEQVYMPSTLTFINPINETPVQTGISQLDMTDQNIPSTSINANQLGNTEIIQEINETRDLFQENIIIDASFTSDSSESDESLELSKNNQIDSRALIEQNNPTVSNEINQRNSAEKSDQFIGDIFSEDAEQVDKSSSLSENNQVTEQIDKNKPTISTEISQESNETQSIHDQQNKVPEPTVIDRFNSFLYSFIYQASDQSNPSVSTQTNQEVNLKQNRASAPTGSADTNTNLLNLSNTDKENLKSTLDIMNINWSSTAILLDHKYTGRLVETYGIKCLKGIDNDRFQFLYSLNEKLPEEKQVVFYLALANLAAERFNWYCAHDYFEKEAESDSDSNISEDKRSALIKTIYNLKGVKNFENTVIKFEAFKKVINPGHPNDVSVNSIKLWGNSFFF